LADVDGDGRLDLLTGSDNCCDRGPGIFWFQRGADGVYTARPKVPVTVGGDKQFMPRFRATLVDWDGDGCRDIVAALSGTRPGLYLSNGAWSPDAEVAAPRPVEGSPDALHHQPCIADWDQDGRLDLIVVRYRGQEARRPSLSEVVWHRNVAEAGEPRLAGPRLLLSLPEWETAVGLSTDDWDRDGWPDLVVGYVRCEGDGRGSSWYVAAGIRVCLRRGSVSPDRWSVKPGP
jgi:hypothetical protein